MQGIDLAGSLAAAWAGMAAAGVQRVMIFNATIAMRCASSGSAFHRPR